MFEGLDEALHYVVGEEHRSDVHCASAGKIRNLPRRKFKRHSSGAIIGRCFGERVNEREISFHFHDSP